MINFIEKLLKFLCLCIGIVVVALLTFGALCEDFGINVKNIVCILLAIISAVSMIDVFIGLKKAKETPLFGDED